MRSRVSTPSFQSSRLFWGSADWPVQVEILPAKKKGEIRVKMSGPAPFMDDFFKALDFLSNVGRHLNSYIKSAQRAYYNPILDKVKRENEEIQRAYNAARKRGLLHRAAVRAVAADPYFVQRGWTFTDFNRLISNPTKRSKDSLFTPEAGAALEARSVNPTRRG